MLHWWVRTSVHLTHGARQRSRKTTKGFSNALWLGCRLRCGGGAHFGVLCSNFIRISSGTTGRSKGAPLGRHSVPSVRESNLMASRVALLLLLLTALRCFVSVEQPATSVLEYHPKLQMVFSSTQFFQLRFAMWIFGGRTNKPTVLYCNYQWFESILASTLDRRGEKPSTTLVHRWDGASGSHVAI